MTKYKGKTRKYVITIIILLALTCSSFYATVLLNRASQFVHSDPQSIHFFYKEKKNSLDGVYLGSSAATRYWMPTRAFEDEGICVYNLGTTMQPFVTTKYLIEEALKEHTDLEVIIIDPRCLVRAREITKGFALRYITDTMPFSSNRNDLIKAYLDYNRRIGEDIDYSDISYYLPFMRSDEESWARNLNKRYIKMLYTDEESNRFKGYVLSSDSYLVEPQEKPGEFKRNEPLDYADQKILDDLLSYCKTLDANVLFVSAPFFHLNEHDSLLNYALDQCEENGFTVLDFNCEPLQSDIEMDWGNEFYNYKHVNAEGAKRYTDYLTEYLVNHYDLEDHRGDPDYKSWQDAADRLNRALEEGPEYMEQFPKKPLTE